MYKIGFPRQTQTGNGRHTSYSLTYRWFFTYYSVKHRNTFKSGSTFIQRIRIRWTPTKYDRNQLIKVFPHLNSSPLHWWLATQQFVSRNKETIRKHLCAWFELMWCIKVFSGSMYAQKVRGHVLYPYQQRWYKKKTY